MAVRPEKITLADTAPQDARYNYLKGTVLERAYFGSSSLYRVLLASGERLQVSIPSTERHAGLLEIGEEVHASFAPDSIVVLTA